MAEAVAATGIDVLVVGQGLATCSWPTPASPGSPSRWARRSPRSTIDGTTVRAGGAAALPVVARRTVAAGLTGFEWAVGVPGSSAAPSG